MRLLRYIVINTALMGALIAGFFFDIEGFKNVAVFATWVGGLISFGLLHKEVIQHGINKNIAPTVPRWVDVSYDLIVISILAYHAYFLTAIIHTVQLILLQSFYARVKEGIDKKKLGG